MGSTDSGDQKDAKKMKDISRQWPTVMLLPTALTIAKNQCKFYRAWNLDTDLAEIAIFTYSATSADEVI